MYESLLTPDLDDISQTFFTDIFLRAKERQHVPLGIWEHILKQWTTSTWFCWSLALYIYDLYGFYIYSIIYLYLAYAQDNVLNCPQVKFFNFCLQNFKESLHSRKVSNSPSKTEARKQEVTHKREEIVNYTQEQHLQAMYLTRRCPFFHLISRTSTLTSEWPKHMYQIIIEQKVRRLIFRSACPQFAWDLALGLF